MGGDLAPSLGGRNFFFISIFTPKNSDDLFLVINQVFFLILTLSFQILCVFIVWNVIYDPFFTTKSPISTKNSLTTPIFPLFKLSRPYHNTTSQNIGGPMHGPSPHLKFFGGRPPSPPRSPPLGDRTKWYWTKWHGQNGTDKMARTKW